MMAWIPPAMETTRAIAAARKSGATMKQRSTPTTIDGDLGEREEERRPRVAERIERALRHEDEGERHEADQIADEDEARAAGSRG